MKKILTILCAFAALLSCSKIQDTAQSPELRVNIRVTRSDDFAATKATVKSKWADGDMIYLFFSNLSSKFLELKYDRKAHGWKALAQGGLEATDLAAATLGKMTAVFLPYGSGASIRLSGISSPSGVFLPTLTSKPLLPYSRDRVWTTMPFSENFVVPSTMS